MYKEHISCYTDTNEVHVTANPRQIKAGHATRNTRIHRHVTRTSLSRLCWTVNTQVIENIGTIRVHLNGWTWYH